MIGPSISKQKFIFLILLLSLSFNQSFAKTTYLSSTSIIPKINFKIKQYPKLSCGIYVKPLYRSGIPEININGDSEFPAASLIKIPIAVILLHKIDKGEISWNKTLILNRSHYAAGAGFLRTRKVGSKVSVKEAFKLMLTISDNTATNMIIDLLGGVWKTNDEIQKLNKELNLTRTKLVSKLGDFKGTNKTCPHDLVIFLEEALEGEFLSKESKKILKYTLFRVINKSLILRGLPDHTKFAHKTGTIGICVGDAGIIYINEKKKVGISIIVKRPFNSLDGQRFIREVSKIVYDEFL
jgi:beta-lactamase class A